MPLKSLIFVLASLTSFSTLAASCPGTLKVSTTCGRCTPNQQLELTNANSRLQLESSAPLNIPESRFDLTCSYRTQAAQSDFLFNNQAVHFDNATDAQRLLPNLNLNGTLTQQVVEHSVGKPVVFTLSLANGWFGFIKEASVRASNYAGVGFIADPISSRRDGLVTGNQIVVNNHPVYLLRDRDSNATIGDWPQTLHEGYLNLGCYCNTTIDLGN